MITLTQVKEALKSSYIAIESLEERIAQLEKRTEEVQELPWAQKKQEEVSYKTPEPTPAISNLVRNIEDKSKPRIKNDSLTFCRFIYQHTSPVFDKVCIWKNGVVTLMDETASIDNPIAVFKSRACARLRLRKAGYFVPDAHSIGGYGYRNYIVAYRK